MTCGIDNTDVRSAGEGRDLPALRIGIDRLAVEPAVVEGIIMLCAGLPLALSLVGVTPAAYRRA